MKKSSASKKPRTLPAVPLTGNAAALKAQGKKKRHQSKMTENRKGQAQKQAYLQSRTSTSSSSRKSSSASTISRSSSTVTNPESKDMLEQEPCSTITTTNECGDTIIISSSYCNIDNGDVALDKDEEAANVADRLMIIPSSSDTSNGDTTERRPDTILTEPQQEEPTVSDTTITTMTTAGYEDQDDKIIPDDVSLCEAVEDINNNMDFETNPNSSAVMATQVGEEAPPALAESHGETEMVTSSSMSKADHEDQALAVVTAPCDPSFPNGDNEATPSDRLALLGTSPKSTSVPSPSFASSLAMSPLPPSPHHLDIPVSNEREDHEDIVAAESSCLSTSPKSTITPPTTTTTAAGHIQQSPSSPQTKRTGYVTGCLPWSLGTLRRRIGRLFKRASR